MLHSPSAFDRVNVIGDVIVDYSEFLGSFHLWLELGTRSPLAEQTLIAVAKVMYRTSSRRAPAMVS